MNKLTTKQANQLDTLRDAFVTSWETLDAAVTAETDHVAAMADYVTAHGALRAFCAEIHEAQTEHFDAKSERWQESEKGETYQTWMDAFGAIAESETPELTTGEDGVEMPEDITIDVDMLSSEQD